MIRKSAPKISTLLEILKYVYSPSSDFTIPLSGIYFEACCLPSKLLLAKEHVNDLTMNDRHTLLDDATGTTFNDLTGNLERLELAELLSNISPTSSFHYTTAKVSLENNIHALSQLTGNLATLPPLSKRVSLHTNLTYSSSPVVLQRVAMGTSVSGSLVRSTQQTTQKYQEPLVCDV